MSKDQITVTPGFNGPLGEVSSIEGPNAIEVLRIACHISALRFNMNTGMKLTRGWSLRQVKAVTGLRTNDKRAHLARLEALLNEAKSRTTYVEGGRS